MDRRNALALVIAVLCGWVIFWKSESVGQNAPEKQKQMSVIPFDLDGHKIYVSVNINDHPKEYTFILDTGALTMIDEKVAEELYLEKDLEIPTLTPPVVTSQ